MAMIRPVNEVMPEKTAYHLVRRAQAAIAGYRHFGDGDLAKYLDRYSFQYIADTLANHFFHRSKNLAIAAAVKDLYVAHLIMAPILQRLPLSAKYDWHRGHLLGHFRRNINGRVRRFQFAKRSAERSYQPDLLTAHLCQLGIHDGGMVEMLMDLYRRHAGGTVLQDLLAHQLFDPVLMSGLKQGYELRHGNVLYRLEKSPFSGSIDLRHEAVDVLDFKIRSVEHAGGYHLEIMISDSCLSEFRQQVKATLTYPTNPEYKLVKIEQCIRNFTEKTRAARSAQPQVMDLKLWLGNKLKKLAGTKSDFMALPNVLVNSWLQRSDHKLHVKPPNFFLDTTSHSKNTYLSFFSPYREV